MCLFASVSCASLPYTPQQANAPLVLGTDEALLSQFLALPSGLGTWSNAGILMACVAGVTAARFQLQSVWPEFRCVSRKAWWLCMLLLVQKKVRGAQSMRMPHALSWASCYVLLFASLVCSIHASICKEWLSRPVCYSDLSGVRPLGTRN